MIFFNKRPFLVTAGIFLLVIGSIGFQTSAENTTNDSAVSPNIVISQFQAAGGNSDDEFIELHNIGSGSVDLNGHRLVYRSSAGTNDVAFVNWTTATIIPAGGYYLITSTGYDGGVPGNISYNPTTCGCAMSASGGGLAVRLGAVNTGAVIDSVGYGSATNIFVESTVTPAPAANTGQGRKLNGCQDTDNNSNDFSNSNPSTPSNAGSSPIACGGGGTQIQASGAANPATVAPNAATLLTVSVSPAINPPSTGISVTGNLTNIGGAGAQQFFDNGTNGDTTAGDNVFSYLATVAANTPGGATNVTATASDAEARSVGVTINLTINAPAAVDDPLLLGNPTNATTSIANENNYLITRPQYSLSYSRAKATPNWVGWRLDSTWVGSAPRQNDYRPDTSLPAGWYQVRETDYSGSGYDRGHICPSGDRTRSIADNSATFLMTNFFPQLPANNQGPWNDFEIYLRTVAGQGNEIYIFSGGHGNAGTVANGQVVVPLVTWKVVVILPNGTNDLERINKGTRTIAIIVPNQAPVNQAALWRTFRTSVDAVEVLTGYDFFSKVPKNTQEIIEKRRDLQ